MAYDSRTGTTLLFGGAVIYLYLNDVWSWDGSAWTQAMPENAPPGPRFGAAMAFDRFRGEAILFGGGDSNGSIIKLDDAWTLQLGAVPAQIASFNFATAGATAPSIQQMTFTTSAGGVANVPPAPGLAQDGAQLSVWSSATLAWSPLASNPSGPATPTALTYSSQASTEAQAYLVPSSQMINVAVSPAATSSTGPVTPEVVLDYVELTVLYQQ